MFVFRKARSVNETLNDLDAYLSEFGAEPVEFLAREVRAWNEFSYAELEELIASGRAPDLIDWRTRYATYVNEHLNPLWVAAMIRASSKVTFGRITIDDSDPRVKSWILEHGAQLVTQLSDESRKAVASIILHGQSEMLTPKQIARQVRPLIGLTARQALANVNYRQKVYQNLIDNGMSSYNARIQSDKAAVRYASKQIRQRAESIVHTELAFAYNRGAHEGILAAVDARLMNHCEMVWTTAGTNRVCSRCLSLKDHVIGRTDEQGVQLPPLHPRCRCTIQYREIKPVSVGGEIKPLTPERIKAIRDAEDKAYRAATDADFGFARLKTPPDWSREILLTNGDGRGVERLINCQRCVVAHEARMRGYDVVARPSWGFNDPLRKVKTLLAVFDEPEVYRCAGKTVAEVEKFIADKMSAWGTGVRAFVWFERGNDIRLRNLGHIIVAQLNENGFVNFGDPQKRKLGAVRCLSEARLDSVKIMRVDDLQFTELVKRCCMNREARHDA